MGRPPDDAFEPGRWPPICQACHEAVAVVRVIRVVDGEEVEAWLCRDCAKTDVV